MFASVPHAFGPSYQFQGVQLFKLLPLVYNVGVEVCGIVGIKFLFSTIILHSRMHINTRLPTLCITKLITRLWLPMSSNHHRRESNLSSLSSLELFLCQIHYFYFLFSYNQNILFIALSMVLLQIFYLLAQSQSTSWNYLIPTKFIYSLRIV